MSLVTLVSGGLDSTLMSVLAKKEGVDQFPLFVNYGQLSAEKEWEACQTVHGNHGLPEPVSMDLRGFGKLISSGLTNRVMRVNEDAFLPGRNALLLLAGASYSRQVRARSIAIGLLNDQNRLFPDQGIDFLRKAEEFLGMAVAGNLTIVAPLITFCKQDVVQLSELYGIVGTYSCHSGEDEPCGKCVSCQEIGSTAYGRR
jgi:7-cyano-7-deazaguanine synthase